MEHLEILAKSLRDLGYAALQVLFKNGQPQLANPLNSVRLLFLDIQLITAVPAGVQTYDTVCAALEKVIAPDNEPYVLLTWSTFPDEHDSLMLHLNENLDRDIPAPAVSGFLDKNQYLVGNGNLQSDVMKAARTIPQVAALLEWCEAGKIAAGEVMSSLLRLVPREERFTGRCCDSLGKLLAAVAREGAGENASNDLTAAMNEGFGPILMDRLLHSTAANRARMEQAWKSAIPDVKASPSVDQEECRALNAMVSVSTHDIGSVAAGSRGAVCSLTQPLENPACFKKQFGNPKETVIWEYVRLLPGDKRTKTELSKTQKQKLKEDLLENCNFRLVGLSAACDHAWGKVPVKKMLLAVEVPASYLDNFGAATHGAIYKTPIFRDPNSSQCSLQLIFNWRYHFTTADNLEGCDVVFRIREPLVSHMTTSYHIYGFRPGTPNYRSKIGST
ncbi:MAG: hypothetical protein OXC53_12435 [Rhodobacteraceae bacterium]|nr:hypothetical protein [Paracoccaceae bacterium]